MSEKIEFAGQSIAVISTEAGEIGFLYQNEDGDRTAWFMPNSLALKLAADIKKETGAPVSD